MFKSIDKKLSEIGFIKIKEDCYGATYERSYRRYAYVCGYEYVQVLDLLHKASNRHLIQSYQKAINADGFNNMVGLTAYEAKLALKKMRQMEFKSIK